ncbi:MAG: peptidoglycan DD-metalloendopeptidase family protein [Candidatus Shapirobacteria bacterium]|jgi:murein DD-endopeptidase MepM/ murein hydrolase activator NlpD|nr:peptidoglycan DD-metalloendopeptidase family protein [Candidatus Shapirobacteria bacterium]
MSIKENIDGEIGLVKEFLNAQGEFLNGFGKRFLGWAEFLKVLISKLMYRQRGRFSQTFVGASMALLFFLTIVFSSQLESLINNSDKSTGSNYLIMAADNSAVDTLVSELPKGEVTEYRVAEGDTVSSIAQKFGVTIDTIMWENNLKSVDAIKVGQILRILPVTGVRYKVKRGETIYSIAKAHQVDAQNIIDYPFNTFSNDETFALSAGQDLMIPEGIKPKEIILDTKKYAARTVAAIPGVVGEGNFMWPTSGTISQRYSWYHRAVDVANRSNPTIVAAQGGTVTSAGWNGGGYGNYVVINHGNGYSTLYAHMLNNSVVVKAGQVVKQGQKLGTMGSTGRSTGTHLHFEIKGPSGNMDPLSVLR